MKTWKISVAISSLLFASISWGQAVTVPNSFQAGQAARAADVNANFDAVAGGVNANAAEIQANAADIAINSRDISAQQLDIQANSRSIANLTGGSGGVIVYAGSTEVGRFLMVNPSDPGELLVVSESGYSFKISAYPDSGEVQYLANNWGPLYYSGAGCTGEKFVASPVYPWQGTMGSVFKVGDPYVEGTTVYYVPRGAGNDVLFNYQSTDANSLCNPVNGSVRGYAVLLNDVSVTGVPNTAPVGNLYLGVPE